MEPSDNAKPVNKQVPINFKRIAWLLEIIIITFVLLALSVLTGYWWGEIASVRRLANYHCNFNGTYSEYPNDPVKQQNGAYYLCCRKGAQLLRINVLEPKDKKITDWQKKNFKDWSQFEIKIEKPNPNDYHQYLLRHNCK